MRPVLFKILQKPRVLHSVQKVLHVVEDERIQVQVNRRGDLHGHAVDRVRRVTKCLLLLGLFEAMQLRPDCDGRLVYELILVLAGFSERLNHQLV